MARTAKGKFRCSRCDRTFSMAAHLARHQSTIHSRKGKKKATKKKTARRGRPAGRRGRRPGRPKGVAGRLKLKGMTLEQLSRLIGAARAEARRKIAEVSKALK